VKIRLNGDPAEVDGGSTVGQIVDGLGRGRGGIAVAVNEEVVPRSRWDATRLAADDRVEVLTAAQGG
jgi:sulfur carrier protein